VGQRYCINEDIMKELALSKFWHFEKTIVEASVKVKFAYVYNSTKTYSGHLHIDYEHAQTLFSRVLVALISPVKIKPKVRYQRLH
jgi:hypothetical protein